MGDGWPIAILIMAFGTCGSATRAAATNAGSLPFRAIKSSPPGRAIQRRCLTAPTVAGVYGLQPSPDGKYCPRSRGSAQRLFSGHPERVLTIRLSRSQDVNCQRNHAHRDDDQLTLIGRFGDTFRSWINYCEFSGCTGTK